MFHFRWIPLAYYGRQPVLLFLIKTIIYFIASHCFVHCTSFQNFEWLVNKWTDDLAFLHRFSNLERMSNWTEFYTSPLFRPCKLDTWYWIHVCSMSYLFEKFILAFMVSYVIPELSQKILWLEELSILVF